MDTSHDDEIENLRMEIFEGPLFTERDGMEHKVSRCWLHGFRALRLIRGGQKQLSRIEILVGAQKRIECSLGKLDKDREDMKDKKRRREDDDTVEDVGYKLDL